MCTHTHTYMYIHTSTHTFTCVPKFVCFRCLQCLDLWLEAVEFRVQLVLGHLESTKLVLHRVLVVSLLVEPPAQQVIVLN